MTKPDLKGFFGHNSKKDLAFLAFLFIFPCLCFFYVDSRAIIRQGMNLWRAIGEGRFFEYYSVNLESQAAGEMSFAANYDMLMNIINGIWQLPLYVIERIAGGDILASPFAKFWGLLQPVLFSFISGHQLLLLAETLGIKEERRKNLYFLYMSGVFLIMPSCLLGQLDVVGLCFLLAAVRALIEKKDKRFLICAIIAVQCKNFGLFVLLPLVLLTEKNVFRIMAKLLPPVVALWLIGLPFSIADPAGVAAKRPRIWILADYMTRARVELFGFEVPVLFIFMGLVCLAAYYVSAKERRNDWILYFAFLGMLPMLICQHSHPQWMIYPYPFGLLLLCKKEKGFGRSVFFESVAGLSQLGAYLISFQFIFNSDNLKKTFFGTLFPAQAKHNVLERISDMLMEERFFNFWTLAFVPFIVWVAGMALVYCPALPERKAEEEEGWLDTHIGLLMHLRALGGFFLCNISVFLVFIGPILKI